MTTFETIQKPVLSPPGWLFPIVWTVLYIFQLLFKEYHRPHPQHGGRNEAGGRGQAGCPCGACRTG